MPSVVGSQYSSILSVRIKTCNCHGGIVGTPLTCGRHAVYW